MYVGAYGPDGFVSTVTDIMIKIEILIHGTQSDGGRHGCDE